MVHEFRPKLDASFHMGENQRGVTYEGGRLVVNVIRYHRDFSTETARLLDELRLHETPSLPHPSFEKGVNAGGYTGSPVGSVHNTSGAVASTADPRALEWITPVPEPRDRRLLPPKK